MPEGHHPPQRAVGLDRPCSSCGQEIYFNYDGPFEGVCGRCTDKMLAKHKRQGATRTLVVERKGGSGGLWFAFLLVFLAGAVAAILARPYLPF